MRRNDGKNGRDPELEKLLSAYREVRPADSEMDSWKRAIREEQASHVLGPERKPREPMTVLRLVVRTAIQVGVAASIGFGVGAWYVEHRLESGSAAISFSQTEPSGKQESFRPDLDLNREVVHVRIR